MEERIIELERKVSVLKTNLASMREVLRSYMERRVAEDKATEQRIADLEERLPITRGGKHGIPRA